MGRPDDRAAAVIVDALLARFADAGVFCPLGLPAKARGEAWVFYARDRGGYGDVALEAGLLAFWSAPASLARLIADRIGRQIAAVRAAGAPG